MKNRWISLLTAFFACLCMLLLSPCPGSRYAVAQDTEKAQNMPVAIYVFNAYAVPPMQNDAGPPPVRRVGVADTQALPMTISWETALHAAFMDSNGNPVRNGRYMQCVSHAFALGDLPI